MQASIKRVHIISRHNEGWALLKQGATRALKVYPTKEDAVIGSYQFLQLGYDLVIHRKDGSVEQYKKAESAANGAVAAPRAEKQPASKKNGSAK